MCIGCVFKSHLVAKFASYQKKIAKDISKHTQKIDCGVFAFFFVDSAQRGIKMRGSTTNGQVNQYRCKMLVY